MCTSNIVIPAAGCRGADFPARADWLARKSRAQSHACSAWQLIIKESPVAQWTKISSLTPTNKPAEWVANHFCAVPGDQPEPVPSQVVDEAV